MKKVSTTRRRLGRDTRNEYLILKRGSKKETDKSSSTELNKSSGSLPLSVKATWKRGRQVYSKLSWGEFEPANELRSVNIMRQEFLAQIREIELEEKSGGYKVKKLKVLEELADLPLKEYEQLNLTKKQMLRLCSDPYGNHKKTWRPLQEAMLAWARRWHLEADWCLEIAFPTLLMWRDYPLMKKEYYWDYAFPTDDSMLKLQKELVVDPPFPGLPPFLAHIELRAVYLRRARMSIGRHIRANPFTTKIPVEWQRAVLKANMKIVGDYCKRVMQMYQRQRNERNERVWKRVDERPDIERDIRWTIEYQVRETSFHKIALQNDKGTDPARRKQGISHSTVLRAVDYVLSIIGLPKR